MYGGNCQLWFVRRVSFNVRNTYMSHCKKKKCFNIYAAHQCALTWHLDFEISSPTGKCVDVCHVVGAWMSWTFASPCRICSSYSLSIPFFQGLACGHFLWNCNIGRRAFWQVSFLLNIGRRAFRQKSFSPDGWQESFSSEYWQESFSPKHWQENISPEN